MKLIITISEKVYKKAIADGWNREYDQNISSDEIKRFDDKSDFMRLSLNWSKMSLH